MHILIQQVCVLFRKGKATLFGGDYLHNHQPVDLHAAWPGSWRLCSSVVSRIQASSSLSCFFHNNILVFNLFFVFFFLPPPPPPPPLVHRPPMRVWRVLEAQSGFAAARSTCVNEIKQCMSYRQALALSKQEHEQQLEQHCLPPPLSSGDLANQYSDQKKKRMA